MRTPIRQEGSRMDQRLRWITTSHRGLYIHAIAFQLRQERALACPGPKWAYMVGVGRSAVPSINIDFDSEREDDLDFFTRDAAEQAAISFGMRIVNVMLEIE